MRLPNFTLLHVDRPSEAAIEAKGEDSSKGYI